MIDASSFLNADSLRALSQVIEYDQDLYIPSSLIRAVEDRDAAPALWSFFGTGRESPSFEDVVRIIGARRFQLFPAEGVLAEPHIEGPNQEIRAALLAQANHPLVASIMFEEWLFLTTSSWLGARSKKIFSQFKNAGAVAVDFGKRSVDFLVRRTLRHHQLDVPPPLTQSHRIRAAVKWVAVGGSQVLHLLDPLIGAVGSTAAGYFILLDP